MINEQLYTAINQQVTEEYAAAYIYRHLANEMDALSFPGLCEWFTAQAAEECEHALKFAKHLIDRGERVCPHTIEIDAPAITGPLDAFKAALEHEKKVSEQIRTITRLADEARLDFAQDERVLAELVLDTLNGVAWSWLAHRDNDLARQSLERFASLAASFARTSSAHTS